MSRLPAGAVSKAMLLADAGPRAGLGHLARSSGLAQALREASIDAVAIALGATAALEHGGIDWTAAKNLAAVEEEPGPGEIVVLDSYEVGAPEVRGWAGEAALVAFWDHGEAPSADVVVSIALEDAAGARSLTGPEYACLGRDYWQPANQRFNETIERILVVTGGSDGTDTAKTLCESARQSVPDADVELVIGPHTRSSAPAGVAPLRSLSSLRDPLLEADLVITAAGQVMLEALASGTPAIAVPVVSNQRAQAELLGGMGAVRIVEANDLEGMSKAILELAEDPGARRALGVRGMETVDGRGALRLAAQLARLVK